VQISHGDRVTGMMNPCPGSKLWSRSPSTLNT